MSRPRFAKGHALGNDYIVVRTAELGRELTEDVVARWCHRHEGIGADGIIEVLAIEAGEASTRVWNADGSIAEVSGNGLRIAAACLAHGPHPVIVDAMRSAGRVYPVRGASEVSIAIDLPPARIEAIRETVVVAGQELRATLIDIGNPHAVLEASEVDDPGFLRVAPLLESHLRWPNRRNVERVEVLAPQHIAVDVFERGVGPTSASGTGASAAAVAAVAAGLASSGQVRVTMAGGEVLVDVTADALTLSGPVVVVFTGELQRW